MDTANVKFVSNTSVDVFQISSQCYKCNYRLVGNVNSSYSLTRTFDTRWPIHFRFQDVASNTTYVKQTNLLKEGGDYLYSVDPPQQLKLLNNPSLAELPLLYLLAALIGLSILWPLSKYIFRKIKHGNDISDTDYFVEMEEWESKIDTISRQSVQQPPQQPDSKPTPKKRRIKSLDVFRGISIILMVFVNYGGGHYYFIEHAVWNGLTVGDLVFPWFIFIMGMAMNLGHQCMLKNNVNKVKAFSVIVQRSLKLFVIGLVLNQGKILGGWRIPGVLQRFGVCYLVVASVAFLTSPSERVITRYARMGCCSLLRDVIPYSHQWMFILGVIGAHVSITFYLTVPGCPKGYLGPGGEAEGGTYFDCVGGAAGYIDRMVLGSRHIYAHPTFKQIYNSTQNYDPEGILGYLTSIVLTFLGLHAGRILFAYKSNTDKIIRWLIAAIVFGGLAFGLTKGSVNEGVIPINKNLWSLSYVFATAATSYLLFTICYVLCDVTRVWNGSPFKYCGMNAIFIYVGHMVIAFRVYWDKSGTTHAQSIVVATLGTLVWVVWSYVLYRKQLFFSV